MRGEGWIRGRVEREGKRAARILLGRKGNGQVEMSRNMASMRCMRGKTSTISIGISISISIMKSREEQGTLGYTVASRLRLGA